MRVHKYTIGLILGLATLLACEDKINPALESATPILVVDGWINNKPGSQVIVLTKSQGYFENTIPPAVSGATVTVTENGTKVYVFKEDPLKPGNYVWQPVANETFGAIGKTYKLGVLVDGELFEASSRMGRVPPIDTLFFSSDKRTGSTDSLTRAEFSAKDPLGKGDTYWIRSYKNGIPLVKPSEINIAYDAGFSEGGKADGTDFILPIRRRINSRDEDDDGKQLSPIVPGDSMNVQILSITLQAFNYLSQVAIQTDRPGGFQELFSKPLANVSTNIVSTKTNGSKALGFFNVSAVSTAGKRYIKKK